ncbi:MAG: hypothetical protein HOE69_02935 [Euryarchaeota archaeon]|nr:hypothetical protein [Euryarchaeota archaeon]
MEGTSVRLLVAGPRQSDSKLGIMITLIILLPIMAPISTASAELQITAEDFGILTQLDNVISQRGDLIGNTAVNYAANNALEQVRLEERLSDNSDPLARVDESLGNLVMVNSTTPEPIHPKPYLMVLNPEAHPDEWANNIWGTLLTADNFVIWTHFKTDTGEEYHHYEEVDFSETGLIAGGLIGLLTGSNPLLHQISIDNDSTEEIEVGLNIDTSQSDGWGVEGNPPTTLWVEPTIEFSVNALDPQATVWDHIEYLEVSLMKQFAYSINPLGEGESYVWVIDSRFTMMPEDFSLEVGLERFWFDISEATFSFLSAIFGIVTGPVDETGISVASVAAPYAIHVDNVGQTDCPDDYDAATMYSAESSVHRCTVGVGFGYIHFDAPANAGDKELSEFAYIDLGIHPVEDSVVLPAVIDLVLRNDDLLTTSFGVTGEGGLDTVEYFADERTDIHLHFHENRSNLVAGPGEPYGNVTDSLGWLRGMPSGQLPQDEVSKIFRMLGSESSPELPGQMPERVSMILAIKNFSKDTTPNNADSTLPVDPTNPPNTLVVLFATQSVTEIEYTSWFKREGADDDHRRLYLHATDLPTGMVLQGTFQLGGDDPVDTLDGAQSDPLSALLDATILNLVDVFIDIGNIVNSIPEAIVNIVGGDGAGTGTGGEISLDFYTSIAADRQLMALGMAHIEIGSSAHPTTSGPHVIMAEDRSLGLVNGRRGMVEPLVPVAISVEHSGLKSLHVVDDNNADEQLLSLRTNGGDPLRFIYMNHDAGSEISDEYQAIYVSNQPAHLDLLITDTNLTWSSGSGINEILYSGRSGIQKQVILLEDFPQNFTMEMDGQVSWEGDTPIGGITIQMGNATELRTMDGDHFQFWQNVDTAEASLSAHISGISQISYSDPEIDGSEGVDGMPSATLVSAGGNDLSIMLRDETNWIDPTLGINGEILVSPLPSNLNIAIPPSSGDNQLSLPNLSTQNGLAGIGFFLSEFSNVGRGVNDILSGFATSITGNGSSSDDFSIGVNLETDTPFDLIADIRQGNMPLDEPEWVHGMALRAGEYDNRTAFHLRTWLPELPPQSRVFVEYTNMSVRDKYHVDIELSGWVPTREEIIFDIKGFEGQDYALTMFGLKMGENTSLSAEIDLERINDLLIPEIQLTSRYEMSNRLEFIHATLLDRDGATRSEVLLNDIPKSVDLNAALGQRVHLSMSVPENHQTNKQSVGSLMMQQQVYSDEQWWPLTVFIREVPGTMTLDVKPSFNFDITQDTSFQGMPTLDYTSSGRGMDLFITAAGRAINSRGDMILLAEDMASHAAIAPTENFGLSVSSSEGGLGRLYVKQTDVPSTPGIYIKQVEAIGENLQSATVEAYWIGGTYPVVKVSDVRGGRIAATARVQADLAGQSFDARAVLIDAQTTSIIPSASTLGINGLTSDLSLLNAVPGFDSSSTHWLFPEPLSTAAATLLFTIF